MIWHPSPNFSDRREGAKPDIVVLHYTAMDSAESARDWLCTPQSNVSAHYVIAQDGAVWHLVEEAKRAWHAGVGAWGAVSDVNSRSIAVEIANRGNEPFQAAQMNALESLLAEICARWRIPPERVIGHSDMAPGRKIDPGPRFDWRRLARAGLAAWPSFERTSSGPSGPSSEQDFVAAARKFGYSAEVDANVLLQAFRSRFRPGVAGALDARDIAIAQDLANRYPVDRHDALS